MVMKSKIKNICINKDANSKSPSSSILLQSFSLIFSVTKFQYEHDVTMVYMNF